MARYCPNCGRENEETARFCAECSCSFSTNTDYFREPFTESLLNNRYELLSVIKSGGMGAVYRAHDTIRGEIVAVKKMLLTHKQDEDTRYADESFRKEADLLSRLNHPGIPDIIDFFSTEDPESDKEALFLVMTFIDGKDLETIMRYHDFKHLPLEEVLEYLSQILEILDYLHTHEPPIVYRDLKPSNVMVRWSDHRIFLVDFGIARFSMPDRKGTLIGTPGYAAPEQYKGYADPRSDLYALGAVIYYLLTGLQPNEGSRAAFAFEPLQKINKHVPPYLNNIVTAMLAFDVTERPATARDIIEIMEEARETGEQRRFLPSRIITCGIWNEDKKNKENKASGNSRKRGFTPLHQAVIEDDIATVERLLTNEFTVDTEADYRWTPLMLAVDRNHQKIADLLITYGADINAQNSDGKSPLHLAAFRNYEELMKLLLSKGADVNAHTREGSTPLHLAAGRGACTAVKLLLEFGGHVDSRDNCGRTPLIIASREGRLSVVETLITHGAHLNAAETDGWTPLHHAASSGHTRVVASLLKNGAEVNPTDRENHTPMDIAQHYRHKRVESILKRYGAQEKPSWLRTLWIRI